MPAQNLIQADRAAQPQTRAPLSRVALACAALLIGAIALAGPESMWGQVNPSPTAASAAAQSAQNPQAAKAPPADSSQAVQPGPASVAPGSQKPGAAANPSTPQPISMSPRQQIDVECADLLKMANDLKADVDKTTKDELSITVVRQASQIEQLAHKVRNEMRPTMGSKD